MICLSTSLPILQVGSYQLSDYDTQWLEHSIIAAFRAAELSDVSLAAHVYAGILYYLKNECPWTLLRIEKLYQRIDELFDTIGLPHLRGKLPRLGPPIQVPVVPLLKKIPSPIELTLHQALRQEIETLRPYGVSSITLQDVEGAVRSLFPVKKWSLKCERLKQDLLSLERQYNQSLPFQHVC